MSTANVKPLVEALERRLALERAARKKAEAALEAREAELRGLQAEQERTIAERTEALSRARDEAVAASSAKSAFLANMSHEIRTPLTSIIGFAELLLQPGERAVDTRESVHTIIRNGRHLLEVINDILDLAKIETHQLDLERIDVPLPLLLRDLNALVVGRAHERGLEFRIVPHLPLPPALKTDPVRLKQILLNFCSNAIKFTPKGSVTLDMRHDAARNVLRFSVIDTGIGMTAEQLSRLFQPFAQADVSTTRRFGGTGLGLYISQQLAAMLGGSIGVESQPGQGSAFHLDLQLDAAVAASQMLTMEGDLIDYGRGDFVITTTEIPELHGRVLLAEDGADNQRLIGTMMRQAGLSATVVGNGREAVNAALAHDFDLVLMDMQMPVMDGLAAVGMLRKTGYGKPIVALTANVMKADLQRYRTAGCDDVLAKPVDRERFYAVLRQHLQAGPGGTATTKPHDSDFMREIAELRAEFHKGLPQQADAIRSALRGADWGLLSGLMHTLKGTAGSYGYTRLTEMAAEVEAELRAARTARAAVLCEGLILEVIGTLRALR